MLFADTDTQKALSCSSFDRTRYTALETQSSLEDLDVKNQDKDIIPATIQIVAVFA